MSLHPRLAIVTCECFAMKLIIYNYCMFHARQRHNFTKSLAFFIHRSHHCYSIFLCTTGGPCARQPKEDGRRLSGKLHRVSYVQRKTPVPALAQIRTTINSVRSVIRPLRRTPHSGEGSQWLRECAAAVLTVTVVVMKVVAAKQAEKTLRSFLMMHKGMLPS